MPILDITLKTNWEQWMIETGGERGSGRSVLAVQHDDDDDDEWDSFDLFNAISPKANVISRLDVDLGYFEAVAQYFSQ